MATQHFGYSDDEPPGLISCDSDDEPPGLISCLNIPYVIPEAQIAYKNEDTAKPFHNHYLIKHKIPGIQTNNHPSLPEYDSMVDPKNTQLIITSNVKTGESIKSSCLHGHYPIQPHVLIVDDTDNGVKSISRKLFPFSFIEDITFIDMNTLTDANLEYILVDSYMLDVDDLTKFTLINCPLVTSIPYSILSSGQQVMKHIEIVNCDMFLSVPDNIDKLINLQTLIIAGTHNSINLSDDLWELNKTLKTLIVPPNTIFQQFLIDNLKISLLPDKYIPKDIQARIANYELQARQDFNVFNIQQTEDKRLFILESDKKKEEFISSLSLIAEEQQCFDNDVD